MQKLLLKKLNNQVITPKYMTDGAVAFDLCAIEDYVIFREVVKVRTGIFVAIPEGYEINVRARSGLSIKYPNYIVISGGGTIDWDYRGELVVPVINNTKKRWEIKTGDRIAQCIVNKIERVEIEVVDELPETIRGEGGFGSTDEKK